MAKYPVEFNDQSGLVDSVNYLLSGNQSLGQSVNGQVNSLIGFQTGNNILPFTTVLGSSLYLTQTVASVDWLDDYTIKFTYPSALVSAIFALGQTLTATGTTVTEYNKEYASVVQTTTTFVIVKSSTPIPNLGSATGGTLTLSAGLTDTFKYLHTDCYGFANISGGTDRAVISAQLKNTIGYSTTGVTDLTYTAAINRYQVLADDTIVFDTTVAYQASTTTLPSTTNAITGLTITSGTKLITTYPYTYSVVGTGSGSGYDQSLNITINASVSAAYDATNTTITIVNGGEQWAVSDTITILGTDLGGATPANDLVLTVSTVGSLSNNDNLTESVYFTAVKDQPPPGSYVYFLDTSYYDSTGEAAILGANFGYRSLTAQVIKE